LFHPSHRDPALRASWKAQGDTPVALVVGRVSTEKNIELAIQAIDRMRQSRPDVICVVVGDGPARRKLAREHPEVHFAGYRTGAQLAACYASADLLLFPSETETFGNVLLEAMASGLATLSYDYAAAAWHVTHRENGLKVPKSDEAAYLQAAESLLDPNLRLSLGNQARQTAESLSWPAVVKDLETIMREVTLPAPSSRQF
jgi:glycosyltransferase involved in cell wall biosynthesis